MNFRAVVTDYDSTLTFTNHLSPEVIASLRALKASGVALVLCTGRALPLAYGQTGVTDRAVIELFDLVVGESGGVIWNPRSDQIRLLGRPPSPHLLKALADQGITPIEIATTMVNVNHLDVPVVDRIVRQLGLRLDKVMGIDSVQYVSPGVCKSLGMRHALVTLGINPRAAVAIGDGPNDVDMLDSRRNGGAVGVAVANAVPEAKRVATYVLQGKAGDGFRELAALVLRGQLAGPGRSLAA